MSCPQFREVFLFQACISSSSPLILIWPGFIVLNWHVYPQYQFVLKGFYFYLYDLDRIIAFIKHSDSSEINCYHVRMDLEVMRGRSLETTIILDTQGPQVSRIIVVTRLRPLITSRSMRIGVLRPRTAAIYSVDSISDIIVGRENRDQPLDGGGNPLPNGYVFSCD